MSASVALVGTQSTQAKHEGGAEGGTQARAPQHTSNCEAGLTSSTKMTIPTSHCRVARVHKSKQRDTQLRVDGGGGVCWWIMTDGGPGGGDIMCTARHLIKNASIINK